MANKNEVFEYLIDQLRQQVNNDPYKQQCEDLAHEVLSLKNQLRDASVQIKDLHMALAEATGGVEAYKLIREQEQSGCLSPITPPARAAAMCGVAKPKECEHDWYIHDKGASMMCKKCGLKK